VNDSTEQLAFDFPETALPAWAKQIVVFDTETTGLVLTEARIVTACVAELDETGKVVSSIDEWLANPGIEIPAAAANVHGVTTEVAIRDGRPAKEVVAEIIDTLRGYLNQGIPVVAYNAPYDFTILHYEALRYGLQPLELDGMPILDPLVLDKKTERYRKGKRNLETVAGLYSIKLDDAHNATADAVASGRVLQALARKHAAELDLSLAELHDQQRAWSLAQDDSFESYMRKSVNPDFSLQRGWPLKLSE
jgi:DNA polymerase III subunit epsilon